jgi:hypothetical protein
MTKEEKILDLHTYCTKNMISQPTAKFMFMVCGITDEEYAKWLTDKEF